jgi:drug/metabolite transporter (DMT)-like permease
MQPIAANYVKGAACGLAAVSIWASWSVVTRLAVTTGLDAWDIPALRFGVAGLLLLPIVIRRGLARDRLGWLGLGGIIVGTGAPYALVVAIGLRFAPAYDAGALNPGCMPLFVAVIAATVLREKPSGARNFGLALILFGALIVIVWHGSAWSISRSLGDGLFLVASFLTACFTVIMRQAKLDPIHTAALVATGSLAIYAPVYLALRGFHIAAIPLADLTIQVIFQGIVVTVIALVLYGRAVAVLGASGGAAFGALVPALSALLAIPLLGEWPNETGWAGIILISAGVYLASGGPLPRRKPQERRPLDIRICARGNARAEARSGREDRHDGSEGGAEGQGGAVRRPA